jgi:hypothetical protein
MQGNAIAGTRKINFWGLQVKATSYYGVAVWVLLGKLIICAGQYITGLVTRRSARGATVLDITG